MVGNQLWCFSFCPLDYFYLSNMHFWYLWLYNTCMAGWAQCGRASTVLLKTGCIIRARTYNLFHLCMCMISLKLSNQDYSYFRSNRTNECFWCLTLCVPHLILLVYLYLLANVFILVLLFCSNNYFILHFLHMLFRSSDKYLSSSARQGDRQVCAMVRNGSYLLPQRLIITLAAYYQ